MMGKTHVISGVALGCFVFSNIDILNVNIRDEKTFIIATTGLVMGSLLPDIDHPKSIISSKLKIVSIFTSRLFKHREYTHSIVGISTMTLLIGIILDLLGVNRWFNFVFLKSLFIGIATHILMDMLTFSGVSLFYPFTKKRVKLLGNYYLPGSIGGGISEMIISVISSFVIYRYLILS